MKLRTFALVVSCAFGISNGAFAATASKANPTLRDKEQAACYDDAKRLCGQFFPDEAKVTACMKPMKAQVSPACAAFYK